MLRQPYLIANWKLFKVKAEAKAFCERLTESIAILDNIPQMAICPSYTLLETVQDNIQQLSTYLSVGAQNMASAEEGAYTGEISYKMLLDIGVNLVILGHSERRQYFMETDELVNAKVKLAISHNIVPVICVGETLAQRESGQTDSVVTTQVLAAIKDSPSVAPEKIVFAYEPVWAIGTGKNCDATEANRVCELIRSLTNNEAIRVLYGGSVKPENFASFMEQPGIDGGLVGGASLDPQSFVGLVEIARERVKRLQGEKLPANSMH